MYSLVQNLKMILLLYNPSKRIERLEGFILQLIPPNNPNPFRAFREW
jgi:hypothetical protein